MHSLFRSWRRQKRLPFPCISAEGMMRCTWLSNFFIPSDFRKEDFNGKVCGTVKKKMQQINIGPQALHSVMKFCRQVKV